MIHRIILLSIFLVYATLAFAQGQHDELSDIRIADNIIKSPFDKIQGLFKDDQFAAVLNYAKSVKLIRHDGEKSLLELYPKDPRVLKIKYYIAGAYLYTGNFFKGDSTIRKLEDSIERLKGSPLEDLVSTKQKETLEKHYQSYKKQEILLKFLEGELLLLTKDFYNAIDTYERIISSINRKDTLLNPYRLYAEVNLHYATGMWEATNQALGSAGIERFIEKTQILDNQLSKIKSSFRVYNLIYSAEVLLKIYSDRETLPPLNIKDRVSGWLLECQNLIGKTKENYKEKSLLEITRAKYDGVLNQSVGFCKKFSNALYKSENDKNFRGVLLYEIFELSDFYYRIKDSQNQLNPAALATLASLQNSLNKTSTIYRSAMEDYVKTSKKKQENYKTQALWATVVFSSVLFLVFLIFYFASKKIIAKNKLLEEKQNTITQENNAISKSLEEKRSDLSIAKERFITIQEEHGSLKEAHQQAQQQKDLLSLLNKNSKQISKLVLDTDSSDEFISKVIARTYPIISQKIPNVNTFLIGLVNKKDGTLDIQAIEPPDQNNTKPIPRAINDPNSICSYVFREQDKHPIGIIENDWLKNHLNYIKELPEAAFGSQPRSMIIVPFADGSGIIGVQSYQKNAFPDQELYRSIVATISDNINIGCSLMKAKENMIMLQGEVSHRIKNHLISLRSGIEKQLAKEAIASSPTAQVALVAAKARLQSVLSVHKLLDYNFKHNGEDERNQDQLDGQKYFTELKDLLLDKCLDFGPNIEGDIALKDAPPIHFELAKDLGLVIVELALNIHQHAYTKSMTPWVYLDIRTKENLLVIKIADRGVGIKEINTEAKENYGHRLMNNTINKKHGGNWSVDNSKGTCFEISIPIAN